MVLDRYDNGCSTQVFVSTSASRSGVKTKELQNELRRYVDLTSSSTSRKDLGFVAAPVRGSTPEVLRVEVNWKLLSRGPEILKYREVEGRKAEG
jgi:hypothetical protein